MRAVVIHSARDLRVEDREDPAENTAEIQVRIEAGGICGSDLHYYQHGGFGAVRIREPMILGHEVSGRVISAPDNSGFRPGDRVAVSPSRPCGTCEYCMKDQQNHCLNMRFYGSAMPMPHIQGAFRDVLGALPEQCFKIAPDVPAKIATFAEPLAVVLHGLRRAGDLRGKRVLITGCGPIGALSILAARAAGAAEIVATDVIDHVLGLAAKIGADRTINVATDPDWSEGFSRDKGHFDLMLEASGNEAALRTGMTTLRPRSVLVQLGLGGDVSFPRDLVVAKEIDMRGAFRFHEEFGEAVAMLNAGDINVTPLLSRRFPVSQARDAFELAGDRSAAMKVQLDFTT